MTDLVSNIHIILQDAQYDSWDVSFGNLQAVAFEDEALMGFVCVFEDIHTLITGWLAAETALLGRFASRLRGAGEKSWNLYCVFVTAARPSDDERRTIRWIEENLERTRKIASAGLLTREDVTTALLPVLPIVSKPVLIHEDPNQRLRRRIAAIAPGSEEAALDPKIAPRDIVRLLGENP